MIPSVDQFEKLGAFYLGREYDLKAGRNRDDLLMYDAKDLCTHALCVGMTGSGKTGLCLSLLEEAAIDGIPALCVDPKGDLANLLLTFPDFNPDDYKPWLEQGEASRKGITLDELAASKAKLWQDGLASWGQDGERIRRFQDSVDIAVYTPGSNIGLPLTILKSFNAPPPEILEDSEAMSDRIAGAASGLLALVGVDADPLSSPDHILLSKILDTNWRAGKNVTIGDLIGMIASPPFDRVGVINLDAFMSPADRTKLSMRLNNLLASPAFSTWLEGEALDIQRLMYTDEGKPRLTILSIAHLSDTERMFFVTILLNELVAWMRTQSGTSSLRAMFYMDEVFGYFPPVAKPPSKAPMLTLLKQARAFGLGVTLATQNPVDLDYKGLSNIGTWFLGRLQTERDKQRVLEGLEGAAAQTGVPFDRQEMEQTLAGLGSRVFLMNNVHDDGPRVFQSRWALSFLSGPLARDQISRLMKDRREQAAKELAESGEPAESIATGSAQGARPMVPAGIEERFVCPTKSPAESASLVYRPAILGKGSLHFVRSRGSIDLWQDQSRIVSCAAGVPDPLWIDSKPAPQDLQLSDRPDERYTFADLPTELVNEKSYKRWADDLKDYFYRHQTLAVYECDEVDQLAPPGSTEVQARLHFKQAAREARDRETENLRDKFSSKMQSLEKKIRTAEDRVSREASQAQGATWQSMIQIGSTLLNGFMGNKISRRASTAANGWNRAARQKEDVHRAEAALQALHDDMADLEEDLKREIDELAERFHIDNLKLDETLINPRKGDLRVDSPVLLWTPWQVDSVGIAQRLF
ncbi:ATP-binding protein [Rosistilla oblonga]|uniref:AAA-like domain protein n=1 Tax=Rosistilla oblonga TaxID=2527990 RepID=A0A518IPX4_9BACT|nr:DUF853 family protein [Rosistilla oblonga]QDV55138.1 AAA-like domain protein [Rosistilla oblonga]